MRDNNDRSAVAVFAHILEDTNEIIEAPEVDTSLRLVKESEFYITSENSSYLNTFKLAA